MKFLNWFFSELMKSLETLGAMQKGSSSTQPQTGCPKCGSNNIQVVTNVVDNTKVQGYGLGKGCCGSVLMGPFGLLCGLCGMGNKKGSINTAHSRVCANCGHKF